MTRLCRWSTMMWLVVALEGSMLASCGLTLDVDPPDPVSAIDASVGLDGSVGLDASREDASGLDAGDDDAGSTDAGSTDAGSTDARIDSGDGDAGLNARDAGIDASRPDAGGPCQTSGECPVGERCARPAGACFGPGTCTPNPTSCSDVAQPVCGCDWETYVNACDAERAGTGVMQGGACPVMRMTGEWCDLVPTGGSVPGGCGRCFDDRDCGGLLPICVASSCRPGGEGICALGPPPIGDCYDGRQCRENERCVGSRTDICTSTQGECLPN